MSIAPYLSFPGTAREAIDYYSAALGGTLAGGGIMTYGQMDMGESGDGHPDVADLVAHAWLKIGDSDVYFSDSPPGMFDVVVGNNIWLMYSSDDKNDVQRKWDALAADGNVVMPIGPTPWTSLYGQVVDKYGNSWQFNYNDPAFMPG